MELASFPCRARRGNTWWQFTRHGQTVGVSVTDDGTVVAEPLVLQAELPLHGAELEHDDGTVTLQVLDAGGQVLAARAGVNPTG